MSTYWAVLCRDLDGKLLGRLTPEGTATNRNIFAAMFDKPEAIRIASNINAAGNFTARVIPF